MVIRMWKSGEAVSKCLFYFGYHVNIMQCMQPNFLFTSQVYPMFMSSVPQAWGTFDRKSTLFKMGVQFLLKGIVFMFWHNVAYIELLYCVTNFELVWTWVKAAVVRNAKKRRLCPNFPYMLICRNAVVVHAYLSKCWRDTCSSVGMLKSFVIRKRLGPLF